MKVSIYWIKNYFILVFLGFYTKIMYLLALILEA